MTKIGKVQGGFLAQWLFSVAGDEDRVDVNSLVFQPLEQGGSAFTDSGEV